MRAWFDGAYDHGSGVAAYGVVIRDRQEKVVVATGGIIPAEKGCRLMNNEAEWAAAGAALWLLSEYDGPLELRGDARGVCERLEGLCGGSAGNRWKARTLELRSLYGSRLTVEWVPRKSNGDADRLADWALQVAGVRAGTAPRRTASELVEQREMRRPRSFGQLRAALIAQGLINPADEDEKQAPPAG